MPDSDSLYHRLFSHPRMVEEFVREFVPEALSAGLNFSGLQRVNVKFHTDRQSAQRRESDVIWRLPTCEDGDIYLYLLLEFQSDIDWWMAARTQVYQGLLYQQVVDEKELKSGARLPPLLLVVLYNGVSRWNAPTDVSELIALSTDSPLWPWQSQVRYYLLDMGALRDDKLAGHASLAALLFRLEQQPSFQEVKQLVVEVDGWFRQHPDYTGLRQVFREMIHRAFIGLGVTGPIPEDLSVFKSNIDRLGETWKQDWKAEGLAEGKAQGLIEGKAEGLVEGKTEGKAEALVSLLAGRFGAVKPSFLERIREANLATLERWFERAIAAPDLQSVFAEQPAN